MQHKEPSSLDFNDMIENINKINPYDCKECGLRFSIEESLDKHKASHIKEKLMLMEEEEPIRRRDLIR